MSASVAGSREPYPDEAVRMSTIRVDIRQRIRAASKAGSPLSQVGRVLAGWMVVRCR
ncbi:hypothetical protein FTUN_4743 [Frigoriglobus tundricola]|uniref:Uncharacterized protein n=1 Tax=Frigoriglobus tundricola TaxID=2774151 RepID=A0A6M5YT48_9BACT|nr:hypothetical protein FTUN_4743 [Frigoriglobus tundricola]